MSNNRTEFCPAVNSTNMNAEAQEARKEFKKSTCGFSWFEYEKRLIQSQSEEKKVILTVEQRLNMAVKFLETKCSSQYGILTKVSTDERKMQDSIDAIPNVFDSAFIIDVLLASGVRLFPVAMYTMEKVILRAHDKASGLWNYFLCHKILPSDVNTSCAGVLGLLACGHSVVEGRKMAQIILDRAVLHEDGLVDVYYPKKEISGMVGNKPDATSSYNQWPVVPRVDLGTTANLLYLLTKLEIDHASQLAASYRLLDQALDAILRNELNDSVVTGYSKYFTNVDVLLFFLSRLSMELSPASVEIGDKVATAVTKRLTLRYGYNDPISLSCRILAAINCKLHKISLGQHLILSECKTLLESQNKINFTFPKVGFYRGHGIHYFGSTALSTALSVAALSAVTSKMGSIVCS